MLLGTRTHRALVCSHLGPHLGVCVCVHTTVLLGQGATVFGIEDVG